MNNKIIMLGRFFSIFVLAALVVPAQAAFTLNGTRYIYEEGRKNISFEVTNHSSETYAGQVWIDNVSQKKEDVYIIPSPPFFKVNAGNKQIIRLMNVNGTLPKDRESLFMLNVQEVPPKPKNAEGNIIAIAMNTRVKILYRPKSLTEGRKDAEKQLSLVIRDGTIWIKNPTPYYFAITKVKKNGSDLRLNVDVARELSQLGPFDEVNIRAAGLSGNISVEALNDWGGVGNYEVR